MLGPVASIPCAVKCPPGGFGRADTEAAIMAGRGGWLVNGQFGGRRGVFLVGQPCGRADGDDRADPGETVVSDSRPN